MDWVWEDSLPTAWPRMYNDWLDDHKFNSSGLPWPIGLFTFDDLNVKDYNNTIMLNLGVASGIFTAEEVWEWAEITQNYQMVLTDAIINDRAPAYGGKEFFQTFLSSFPTYGGFKFAAQDWDSDPVIAATLPKQIFWSPGWGGEYKWNDAVESNSEEGHEGQFTGLDYMHMYNLYHYFYRDEITTEYEETYDCFCGSTSWEDINALPVGTDITTAFQTIEQVVDEGLTIHPKIKEKLRVLDFCTENVFTGTSTASIIDIKQLFDHYHDIGIALTEYQTEQFTINDGGQVNIESRLVICNTKELTVENGGEINLAKGEILIKPGAKLIVEGIVNVAPHTKIIVESEGEIILRNGGVLNNSGYIELKGNARITYEEGAIFTMKDDGAELHFNGGDLFLETNADFTFEKGATQSGQLRFSDWGKHIFTQGNNSILLTGNGEDDPILVIDKDADFWPDSETNALQWITMTSGKVVLDSNARLVSLADYTTNNVKFESLDKNRGLVLFDETNISNSTFNSVPVYAPLFYKNSGTFNMTLSEVNNGGEDLMVRIKGMGYNISQTEFNGEAYYMVSAQNTTEYSQITNCEFNGTLTTVGVIDNSNGTVELKKNDFNNVYAGVHKLDGTSILRCNDFTNFKYAGAIAHNNCVLDLSSNAQGGYNTFGKESDDFGQNIALWNAQGLLLHNGYNFFDERGTLPIISGTMQIPPPIGDISTLLAQSNKWNLANIVPAVSDFSVTSSITGDAVNFNANSPTNAACPVSDDFDPGSGDIGSTYQSGEALINSANFTNTLLSDAINTCIESTKFCDASNSNCSAIDLFAEVLVNYPSYDSTLRNIDLTRYGVQFMKQTLQHAFESGEITREQNATQFHSVVQGYVNVLNAVTSVDANDMNREALFYWEMDKVHLFHLLGNTNMAILTLVNAESCGLDSLEQVYVNHWKAELDEEIRKVDFGYEAEFKDTVWIDTTLYNIPTNQLNGNFGSEITGVNSVTFYNCANPRIKISDETILSNVQLSVYPNPNNGVFNVEYELPENASGLIIVHNMEGKEVLRINCSEGKHIEQIDISNVQRGTYIYNYYINEIITKTGNIVVE